MEEELMFWIVYGFNSRTREGCDSAIDDATNKVSVSIHAPVKGAIPKILVFTCFSGFNSRTREGCDQDEHLKATYQQFQFTHP